MKSRKRRKITYEQYNELINKIILKYGSVPDALVAMLEFTGGIELVQNVRKHHKEPTK
jgi:hypothetical protein